MLAVRRNDFYSKFEEFNILEESIFGEYKSILDIGTYDISISYYVIDIVMSYIFISFSV